MERTIRIVGLGYVRRSGTPTARALVEALERENALLRLRSEVVNARDVRGELRQFVYQFRMGIALAATFLALAIAYEALERAWWNQSVNDVTVEMVGDRVTSISNPGEAGR